MNDEKARARTPETIDHLRATAEKALAEGGQVDIRVSSVLAKMPAHPGGFEGFSPTGGAIWQIVVTPGAAATLELARLVVKRADGGA